MSDFLNTNGVLSKGFGFSPKQVMKDTRLSIEAKAIYSYISSYAGAGMVAFPSVELICHDLNISKNRYLSHRKQLVDCGYISITRERKEKGFSNNIYTLVMNPVCTQNVDIGNVDIGGVTIQNESTNNNSLKNNSSNSNKPIIDNVRFEEFWNEYPKARRINKKKCLSYWKNNKLDNQSDLIINNLKNQVAKQYRHTEDRFIPHAYTYLNGERWTDPIIEVKRSSQDLSGQDYENDRGFD